MKIVYQSKWTKIKDIDRKQFYKAWNRSRRGLVPLLVAGIIALVAVIVGAVGGGVALVATGEKSQAIACLTGDIPHDMAIVGMLVGALDGSGTFDLDTLLADGGPIMLCELKALAADEELKLQSSAAVKEAAKAALVRRSTDAGK